MALSSCSKGTGETGLGSLVVGLQWAAGRDLDVGPLDVGAVGTKLSGMSAVNVMTARPKRAVARHKNENR
jgi:hypothetical protein